MKKNEEKLLRLWKARQEAEGHDVSDVNTLEEAKHFFDKKPAANTTPSGQQKQSAGKPKKPAAKKAAPKTPKGA